MNKKIFNVSNQNTRLSETRQLLDKYLKMQTSLDGKNNLEIIIDKFVSALTSPTTTFSELAKGLDLYFKITGEYIQNSEEQENNKKTIFINRDNIEEMNKYIEDNNKGLYDNCKIIFTTNQDNDKMNNFIKSFIENKNNDKIVNE